MVLKNYFLLRNYSPTIVLWLFVMAYFRRRSKGSQEKVNCYFLVLFIVLLRKIGIISILTMSCISSDWLNLFYIPATKLRCWSSIIAGAPFQKVFSLFIAVNLPPHHQGSNFTSWCQSVLRFSCKCKLQNQLYSIGWNINY